MKSYNLSMHSLCTYSITFILLMILFLLPVLGNAQNVTSNIENKTVAKIIAEAEIENSDLAVELEQIYHATKKYQDVQTALDDGYIRDPFNICDTGPMMGWPAFVGAMGIHYVRPDLLGLFQGGERVNGDGLHIDFNQPGILIYEPNEDGTLDLVAVENLVFQDGWHSASNERRPNFMGYDYFSMADNPDTEVDEAHKFEPHYDLHMWLYRKNPSGLFMPFNPNVSCEAHEEG